jgi:hypothetical protein
VQPDGDAIISEYTLGPFVYLGIYGHGVVQMIDEAGKPVTFPEDAFAGGADTSIDAMDGFLTASVPPQEEPKAKVTEESSLTTSEMPSGKPPAPIASGGPVPKPIVLSGPGKSKFKSGVVKLEVTCGLPCTVSGSVVPPAAKAARSTAPRPLPFKSIHLPGSGKPVLVTLRFTAAQKKLIARLLRLHRKVVVRVSVTEAPGGAPPGAETIRII